MLFTKDYFTIYQTVYFYKDVDALPRNKDTALLHFCAMICRSWTFERMTQDEKERAIKALLWANELGFIKGSFDVRYGTYHAIHNAFLSGLGYNGPEWREVNEE